MFRQVGAGVPVAMCAGKVGVSEATFYIWRKRYAHLGVAELRQMRQLEPPNTQLKKLVTNLSTELITANLPLRQWPRSLDCEAYAES